MTLDLIQHETTLFLQMARPEKVLETLSRHYQVPLLPIGVFSLNRTVYEKQVSDYRTSICLLKAGYFMTIWRFDIGAKYHDIALTVYPTGIEVFDSMMVRTEYSPYTQRILDTVRRVFSPPALKATSGCFTQSLQYTGGDDTEPPQCWIRHKKSQLLCSYHPEAQNRFGWGWCLFYLHARLQRISIDGLVRQLPPLIVIKRYLYGLVSMGLIVVDEDMRESLLRVWDSDTKNKSKSYGGRRLTVPDKYLSLEEVISCSGNSYCYTRIEPRTTPPINHDDNPDGKKKKRRLTFA